MQEAPYRMLVKTLRLDHSTCVHAYKKWVEKLETNQAFPKQYAMEAKVSNRVGEKVLEMLNEGTMFVMPHHSHDIGYLLQNYDRLAASHIEACLKGDVKSTEDHETLILAYERRIKEIQSPQEGLVPQGAA